MENQRIALESEDVAYHRDRNDLILSNQEYL